MNWLLARAKRFFEFTDGLNSPQIGVALSTILTIGVSLPTSIVYLFLVSLNKNEMVIGNYAVVLFASTFASIISIACSIFVGGVAKSLLTKLPSDYVIGINLLSCAACGVVVAATARASINVLSKNSSLTEYTLTAFVIIWSAMSFNMLKAPWDEMRDRISKANSGSRPSRTRRRFSRAAR